MITSLLERVGVLQPPRSFSTVDAALVAVRCWLDAAAAGGHKPASLCATLNISDQETTALLGTRRFIASMITARDKGSRERVAAILQHAPEEAFVLVSKDDVAPCGDGISNINAVLAVTAARAAAQ